jgi:hypothetical protein
MRISATITWIILLVLTITSALISKIESTYIVFLLLLLAVLKFFGIVFQFMELKKAHPLWKGMIIGFILIFTLVLLITI